MEQIPLVYNLLKETVTAITMLYKNTKSMVHSSNGDINFFFTGVLQGDKLVLFLFIICQDNVLGISIQLMKENSFTIKKKKARSKRHPAETITNAGYADDLALLANTPTQSEFQLH